VREAAVSAVVTAMAIGARLNERMGFSLCWAKPTSENRACLAPEHQTPIAVLRTTGRSFGHPRQLSRFTTG
jgi:hypothetical protein